MEHYRYLIITLSIALPIIAAYGWKLYKSAHRYNKKRHIITFGDTPSSESLYHLEAEEAEKSFKDYVTDNFC